MIRYRLEYKNEDGGDPPEKPATAPDENDAQTIFSIPIYCTHHIAMENITFYMEEFRILNGQRVPASHSNESMIASNQFQSTISDLPETEQQLQAKYQRKDEPTSSCSEEEDDDQSEICRSDAIMLANVSGAIEMRITMKVGGTLWLKC